MTIYFEDSQSVEFSLSPEHMFYCFYNSTMEDHLPIEPHWHYYVEMLYVTIGSGQLIINGHTMILNEGDLVFILPRDVHSIKGIGSEDFKYAVIKFDPDILFDSPFDSFMTKNILPIIHPIQPSNKYFSKDRVTTEMVQAIMDTMTYFQEKLYGYEFIVKSKLLFIFYTFVNELKYVGIDILSHSFNYADFHSILPAFKFIHNTYRNAITANDAAKYCHLSYSYFSRQFKKVSGITFTKYLNFVRITEAERLLIHRSMSVTEIGYHVGFMDTSYFIRQFKSFKKITPKQFVKLTQASV